MSNPIVGSTRTLQSEWLDKTVTPNVPIDPVVSLRVRRPDGTVFDASPILNPETGTFTYELALQMAGMYYAEWTGTTVSGSEVCQSEICVEASAT